MFNSRLKLALKKRSSRSVARECALSETAMRKYIIGESTPNVERLTILAKVLDVSVGWLATGEGEMDNTPVQMVSRSAMPGIPHEHWLDNRDDAYACVPLYGDVNAAAGYGSVVDSEQVTDWIHFKKSLIHKELHAQPNDLYLIMVDGESMEPTLRPGDTILIDRREAQQVPRDGIYVLQLEHTLLVKRLQRMPGKKIKVTSDNTSYVPFELDLSSSDDVTMIGRVVWAGRRF